MSGKPASKEQYGPPLGSQKSNNTLLENKASSSISLKPQIPSQNFDITLANILKSPTPVHINRYTPLQYTNILVGPKDFTTTSSKLLTLTPSQNLSTQNLKPQSSIEEYLDKPETLPVIILEKEWIKESPHKTAKELFPTTFHHLPTDLTKTRTFYEFILVDTDSAEISHNQDKEGNIIYSKIKILHIITSQEWNQPPHETKSFSRYFIPQNYSYYDYIEAWTNVLYLCTERHSWFIWFKKGISLKFPKWFKDFGPLPTIFPEKIIEVYAYFREKSTFVSGYRLISFVASQAITWILSWNYLIITPYKGTDLKMLSRQIRIKWWKKFQY